MNEQQTLPLKFACDVLNARIQRQNRITMSFVVMQAAFIPWLHSPSN